MRAKRAKFLRRLAQSVARGQRLREYTADQIKRLLPTGVVNPDGTKQYRVVLLTGTVRLVKNCTRSVYQRMKKTPVISTLPLPRKP